VEAWRGCPRELRAGGRAVLDALRHRPEAARLRTFVSDATDRIAAREAEMAPPEPAPAGRTPRPGDTVEVVGRGIRGELLELGPERARGVRGGLQFEGAAAQLRVVEAPAARERIAVNVTRPDADAEPGEINLIGQRARDALAALASFLDRAMRAGRSEVRVVHGVGTGALRKAVQ